MKPFVFVIAFVTAVNAFVSGEANALPESIMDTEVMLHLKFLKPGSSGYFKSDIKISSLNSQFVVQTKTKKYTVKELSNLRGLVSVSNKKYALEYVRLGTLCSRMCLWNLPKEVEIIRIDDLQTMPNFGSSQIRSYYNSAKLNPEGVNGVVSKLSFMKNGFTVPQVSSQNGNYVITRWMYIQSSSWQNGLVQQVCETVKSNGEYRRKVVESKVSATYKDVRFVIPYRR